MQEKLANLKKNFVDELQNVSNLLDLDKFEQKFFSRKSGEITLLMKSLKEVSAEKRKELGKLANDAKKELQELLDAKVFGLKNKDKDKLAETEAIDVTQPKLPKHLGGHLHPITIIQNKLEDLFTSMGFEVEDGPELESDYYNFSAMNIPEDHPARDMQDTFYVKDHSNWVMRTHTSSMQVRSMQKRDTPMRVVIPGRCFRNEATDPRHEHTFYQLEGFVVDKNVSLGDMKGVLEATVKHLYGKNSKIRLRPKFYPFVEPGVNGEVSCFLCMSKGCRVCKNTGWLEIFGAGMIHPSVLKEGNINPDIYQGFAFGFGLNRLVMLKYNIEDIRNFQSGDLRFLNQF